MVFKAIVFATIIGLVIAESSYGPPSNSGKKSNGRSSQSYGAPSRPARYNFEYAVNDRPSGNDFGHEESRDGEDTEGEYFVQLPDGRLQTVTYWVNGDSGFVADVNFEGEAKFPQQKSSSGYGNNNNNNKNNNNKNKKKNKSNKKSQSSTYA